MKTALVIQESLRFLGGGEIVCLSTCAALQNLGYHVRLVTDVFPQDAVEEAFGMGEILSKCEQIDFPEFGRNLLRLRPLIGLYYAEKSKQFLQKQNADLTFVTRDLSRPRLPPDRPLFRFVYESSQLRNYWENYRLGLSFVWRTLFGHSRSPSTLLALSPSLARELVGKGYPRTKLVYPSYGKGFRPRPKRHQVVYATFLAPQKRLGDFMEIARRLPKTKFYLVGRDTKQMNQIYNGYANRMLSIKPNNVEYVETRIRQMPELLEESEVYLHTSTESGMGIAVMEAMSAGCMPIAPSQGGAGDLLDATRVGFRYDSIDGAVDFIESRMRSGAHSNGSNVEPTSPEEIASRAKIFGLDAFQARIDNLIAGRN